jgi:hypothetical protein
MNAGLHLAHEPPGRAGCLQPAAPRRGEDTAPYRSFGSAVPMRGSRTGEALPMNRGPKAVLPAPHSKRWRDSRGVGDDAKRLECGALGAAFGRLSVSSGAPLRTLSGSGPQARRKFRRGTSR